MQKLIQWLKDLIAKYNKPTPTPTPKTEPQSQPTPSTGCGCDLTLPLCDPNPAKYTESYVSANCNFEECGIEAQLKIIARAMFWRGNHGGWWMLSSLVMDNITRNPNGTPYLKCFSKDGYRYHVRGYALSEPTNSQSIPTVRPEGAKFIICDCRKIK